MLARLANEIHAMRSELRVGLGYKPLMYDPILTPGERVTSEDAQQESRALHDDLIAQLRGEKREIEGVTSWQTRD